MLRLLLAYGAVAIFFALMSSELLAQEFYRYSSPPLVPGMNTSSAGLGLKPDSSSHAKDESDFSIGLSYDSGASSVLVPIDNKNEWGVGINLNINASRTVEVAPTSALGLQSKRQPGLTFQKKF